MEPVRAGKTALKNTHPAFLSSRVLDYRYFFLNMAPAAQTPITVTCGGWERCAPDYEVTRTNFQFFAIEYVARGRGTLILDGVATELRPGTIFTYKSSTPLSIRTSSEDPLVKYFIDFAGMRARGFFAKTILGQQGAVELHQTQAIHDLFDQMIEVGQTGGQWGTRMAALLLDVLALRLEENALEMAEARSEASQTYERCRQYLTQNFREIGSISDLARATHINPAYMSRLFRRYTGESPHQVLMRLKMNEAAAQLAGGGSTVKSAAAAVGFADPYHFSRVFKRLYGVAPTRFRGYRPHLK